MQIFQENINKFLDIAQILKLDGLLASHIENEQHEEDIITKRPHEPTAKQKSNDIIDIQKTKLTEMNGHQSEASVSTVSFQGSLTSVDDVEQKVMEFLGENEIGDFLRKLCGKVDKARYGGQRKSRNMKNHIETHLEGISFSCNLCGKQFRSRNSLNCHKSVFHKNK